MRQDTVDFAIVWFLRVGVHVAALAAIATLAWGLFGGWD